MKKDTFKKTLQEIFSLAGITFNGTRPWDIQVHNETFYQRVLAQSSLGFGESYLDGWWDCEALDECINKIERADLQRKVKTYWKSALYILRSKFLNLQSRARAFEVGEKHYDLGNDLFKAMLDKRMNYSCAYWKDATNLDEAQEAKLELICRKLGLQSGMSVLDIGCGFGAFSKYAAEKYGAEVVGITVSKEQAELSRELCRGLPVEIRLQDYKGVSGTFDRVISIGMFEHVGHKNYRTFMKVFHRCLKDDGLALLHTMGTNRSTTHCDPYCNKYIFPNGMLPSISQIGKAIEGLFMMEDWHNFGTYYDRTLMAWHENFEKAWPHLKKNYSERFYRMWRFYLLGSAGCNRARDNQLWQIVMTKPRISQPECRIS